MGHAEYEETAPSPLLAGATSPGNDTAGRQRATALALRHGVILDELDEEQAAPDYIDDLHAEHDRAAHHALRFVAALQISLNRINDSLKHADFESCVESVASKYSDMSLAPSTSLMRATGFNSYDTEASTAESLLLRVARQLAISSASTTRSHIANQVRGALERIGVNRMLSVLLDLHDVPGDVSNDIDIVEFNAADISGFTEYSAFQGTQHGAASASRGHSHYDTPESRHHFTGRYLGNKARRPPRGAATPTRSASLKIGAPVPISVSALELDYDPLRDVRLTHEAPSLTAPPTEDNLLKVDLPAPPPFDPERVPPVMDEHLTSDALKAELIATYRDNVFLPEDEGKPCPAIPGVEFDITYEGDLDRIRAKPFRTTPKKLEALRHHIRYLSKRGIIRPSNSFVTSRAFIKSEPGKEHGRMCIDFVRLNEGSKTQLWPIPSMQGLFDQLAQSTYVSVIDGKDAYYGVTLSERAIPFTSFVTPDGQWEFMRGCFGLASLPSAFSRIVAQILNGCNSFAVAYLDDIIIFSRSLAEHRQHLHAVFQRFEAYNFLASAKKMQINKEEVKILGHVWTRKGLKVDPSKLDALDNWPSPTSPAEVRSFLGFAGWLRSFIPKFAEIAQPLQDMTTLEKADFNWTATGEEAMRKLIAEFKRPGIILAHFHADWKTRLTTDASGTAVGATLEQLNPDTGVWHPLEFFSKALSKRRRESHPTPYWLEMYGLISALRKWNHYLMSLEQPFEVFTDHAAITFLTSNITSENTSLLRWKTEILTYPCLIRHIPGVDNAASDSLSRIPWTTYAEASDESDDYDLLPRATFAAVHALASRPNPLADERIVDDAGLRLASIVISAIESARSSPYSTATNKLLIEEDFEESTPLPDAEDGHTTLHPEGQSITQLQRSCLELEPLTRWLETSSDKARKENFTAEQCEYFATVENDYFIHRQHRSLYHKAMDAKGQILTQIVIPETLRVNYLLRVHDEPTGGHFGGYAMFHRLSRHFWWEKMLRDCRRHVQRCTSCRLVKSRRTSEYYLVEERLSTASVWDVVSLDFVGPLPPSDEGFTYILAILDNFSLYTMFIPMKAATSVAVADVLYKLIMQYGAMRKLLSDRGSNLNLSKVLQAMTSVLNIKQTMTASYNPEGNSQNERSHRWLKSIMRIFVNVHDKKWADTLDPMAFAYNTTPRTDIKLSPFYIFHGRDPVMVEDLAAMPAIMHMPDAQAVVDKTRARVRQVTKAREILNLALREARRTSRVQKRLRPVPFKVGDFVLLRNLKPVNTLSIPFYGPYVITERTSTVRFKIQHVKSQRVIERVHAKHLRSMPNYYNQPYTPFSIFNDDGATVAPPPTAPAPAPAPTPTPPTEEKDDEPAPAPTTPPEQDVPRRAPKVQRILDSVVDGDMAVFRRYKTAVVGQVLRRVDDEDGFSVHEWGHNDATTFGTVKYKALWHTEEGVRRSISAPALNNLRSTDTDYHTSPVPVTIICAYDDIIARFKAKEMKHHRLPGHVLNELRKTRLKVLPRS